MLLYITALRTPGAKARVVWWLFGTSELVPS